MIRTTPFYERTSALNETGLWEHWSNHLAAVRYQMSDKFEYFAVRNAAGLFDSSPLYKYRIYGPDAERFLAGVLARDIRTCPPGHAQYTAWAGPARPERARARSVANRNVSTARPLTPRCGLSARRRPRAAARRPRSESVACSRLG